MATQKRDLSLPVNASSFASFMEREISNTGPVWRYGRWDLWRDFCAWLLSGLQEDACQQAAVEARKPDAVPAWANWREALLHATAASPCEDHLGSAYMLLGIGSDGFGQFFTPSSIAEAMAEFNLGRPFDVGPGRLAHAVEPCCGAGGLVLAAEKVRRRRGMPPLIWTCIDLDLVCCQMTAVQLFLNDIPALVLQANSLRWGFLDGELAHLVSPRVSASETGEPFKDVNTRQASLILLDMERHALEMLSLIQPVTGSGR